MSIPSDIEIAQAAVLKPIETIAAALGIDPEAVVAYGRDKAKIDLSTARRYAAHPRGRLVLVTAASPTPAGEGKTTMTVGLVDALNSLGHRAIACLREPSMGPVFGIKGGAAGGGYSQVVPMTDINLHFTGDLAALTAANNLLAALIDNHIQQGNALQIDPRTVTWRRCVDLNDRALRRIVVGLGGTAHGVPREDGFDITVASELMAILCMTDSIADLKRRVGDIVVGRDYAKQVVRARDLRAEGAVAVLLKDALAPNLVQTLEHSPAFVHGGPFANIAHGCSSLIATTSALGLADLVVTEAGFGADLGAEKFFDIKCRAADLHPALVVVVATVRSMKFHGGVAVADLGKEDLEAVKVGAANVERHLSNLTDVHGQRCVVAINRFPSDTEAELALARDLLAELGVPCFVCTHVADGGAGAIDLAKAVVQMAAGEPPVLRHPYPLDAPLSEKIEAVAIKEYGASSVSYAPAARKLLARLEEEGFGGLPVCIAKTPYSFSTDPTRLGAPRDHVLEVREVRLSAGAGFVVVICGDVMTMPGLPTRPAAESIDIDDDGVITGLS